MRKSFTEILTQSSAPIADRAPSSAAAEVTPLMADQAEFPGVDLAYDLAVASYDSVIRRIDAMDNRLQTILAFAATTTAVVPTVANSRGLTFASPWLYVALSLFVAQLLIGTVPRFRGTVKLIRPQILWQRWLGKEPWTFKKDYIFFAARHFEHNASLLRKRWLLTVTISTVYFLEIVFLLIWIATSKRINT